MPLSKSTLAQELERVFNAKPASSVEAAAQWANAYAAYAGSALSVAASLPVNAQANLGLLLGAFQGGLSAFTPVTAGALVAQGIMAYWQAMAWLGPVASGATAFPGNVGLAAALAVIFADLSRKSASEKANELASAFDLGAKGVVISDVPFVQPAPPIIGPIL
jgi:hypothetical protein